MKAMTLPTTLLTLALPWSVAVAKPRQALPPTTLSHTEQVCQAYGTFALNRALDRNNGYPLLYILDASRRYDRQHQAGETAEAVHDRIIRAVWANPDATPAQIRQSTEVVCLEGAEQGAPPGPRAMQRY